MKDFVSLFKFAITMRWKERGEQTRREMTYRQQMIEFNALQAEHEKVMAKYWQDEEDYKEALMLYKTRYFLWLMDNYSPLYKPTPPDNPIP